VLVVGANPELGTPPDVLIPRPIPLASIMNPNIKHVHAGLVLAVVAAYVRQRPLGLQDDGDPVQLLVARMKDVTRHGGLDSSAEESIERGRQISRDRLGRASLDLVAVDEVYYFAVP
jgi:hypothetical protein